MSGRFDGRVAIVTGASRGIGRAVAERLLAEGARVCITARKPDPLRETAEMLGGADRVLALPGRADDPEHHAETVAAALERFGRVDVLVNNAGTNPAMGPILDIDPGAARKIFEVNVLGALGWVREAHRQWMGRHGGAVVNLTSIAGIRPSPGIGLYAVSKAALGHLTAELAAELAPGIRVNAVAPALVKTRFAAALFEGREPEVAARYPLGRLGTPADIAGAVAWLASDDAAWVTGHTLVSDGGLLLAGGL